MSAGSAGRERPQAHRADARTGQLAAGSLRQGQRIAHRRAAHAVPRDGRWGAGGNRKRDRRPVAGQAAAQVQRGVNRCRRNCHASNTVTSPNPASAANAGHTRSRSARTSASSWTWSRRASCIAIFARSTHAAPAQCRTPRNYRPRVNSASAAASAWSMIFWNELSFGTLSLTHAICAYVSVSKRRLRWR